MNDLMRETALDDLMEMPKAELLGLAEDRGVALSGKPTKLQIAEALIAFEPEEELAEGEGSWIEQMGGPVGALRNLYEVMMRSCVGLRARSSLKRPSGWASTPRLRAPTVRSGVRLLDGADHGTAWRNARRSLCFPRSFLSQMAEREGFEPPEDCSSTVFKTAALSRSATSPGVVHDGPLVACKPGGRPNLRNIRITDAHACPKAMVLLRGGLRYPSPELGPQTPVTVAES